MPLFGTNNVIYILALIPFFDELLKANPLPLRPLCLNSNHVVAQHIASVGTIAVDKIELDAASHRDASDALFL